MTKIHMEESWMKVNPLLLIKNLQPLILKIMANLSNIRYLPAQKTQCIFKPKR